MSGLTSGVHVRGAGTCLNRGGLMSGVRLRQPAQFNLCHSKARSRAWQTAGLPVGSFRKTGEARVRRKIIEEHLVASIAGLKVKDGRIVDFMNS
jgi:hypothetical protein